MDLVQLFEVVKMVGIGICIILFAFVGLSYVFLRHGYSDEVILPWKKDERKARKRDKR